ncbi:hypothetical protein HYN59_06005 [Flavobacterium album]|uniref:Uncharacterized protein n=1 Tax=Flavobacterium album TaxID=2175091 RepID=A0A2S1QWA6_9FLAO|nr:hypothetical protein [Flavobacterium album]AWH84700.1 hypothetical protein HYN59_06005 [Flavobacterium album]
MDYKISIPKPCHEDWTAMTPNEQGRFCGQCAKTVTDFTGMSATEIQSYLLANSGQKVCGRFTSGQLDKFTITIPEKVLYTQTRFRNVFLLALLVTMGTTLLSCNNGQKIGEVAIEKDSSAVDDTEMRHTVGIIAIPDSLPPQPQKKSCGSGVHVVSNKEAHLTGAVAVEPLPPTDDSPMMGDIVVSPKIDSFPPPQKVRE